MNEYKRAPANSYQSLLYLEIHATIQFCFLFFFFFSIYNMDEQDGDELNVLPSPGTTRDGLQRAGRRAQRYVKCFYQQFFFVFNRKKKG